MKDLNGKLYLKTLRSEGSFHDNNIRITIEQEDCMEDHILAGGFGGAVNFKPHRLLGGNGRLATKVNTYRDIVTQCQVAYIICINADYHSWITPKDLYEGLYGPYESVVGTAGLQLYSQGLYYQSDENGENSLSCVSGILFMQGDDIIYFHNYKLENKLDWKNRELFLQYQYDALDNALT